MTAKSKQEDTLNSSEFHTAKNISDTFSGNIDHSRTFQPAENLTTSHFKLLRADQDETMKSAFSLHEIDHTKADHMPEDSPIILHDHLLETEGVLHTGFVSPIHLNNVKHEH